MQDKAPPFKKQLISLAWLIGLMLVVELMNLLSGRMLTGFGIIPRSAESLPYIFTAPFIHGSLSHFLSNMLTFSVFVLLLFQFGTKRFVYISLLLIVMTGLTVWLLGRNASHIGASGIIYGYFGFLVLAGIISRRLVLSLISVFVAIFYGAMIFGVLPSSPYVSWESHLFGFLSGIVLAITMREKPAVARV